jgi:hypothetical protein
MKNKMPLLSVLEFNQTTGNPSAGFYDNVDVAAEQRRCFGYDWLAKPVPTLEQLDEAYKNGEEIKKHYVAEKNKAAAA